MAKKAKKAKAKAKKSTTAKKVSIPSADKPRTKSQIYSQLAEAHDLSRKDVQAVFETMSEMIKKDLGKSGPGVFNLAGLMKIKSVTKPATKSRKMISPFTGEEITVKAKPARKAVKVTALKSLKEMVGKK